MTQTLKIKLIQLSILAAILSLGMSYSTHAAVKKKVKPQEIYSATEEDGPSAEDEALPSAPTRVETRVEKTEKKTTLTQKNDSLADRVQSLEKELEALKKASLTQAATSTTLPPEAPKKSFDTVPDEQKDGISKRLELVSQLIKRHGRAYDYRQHTLKELRTILAELDEKAFQVPPSPSNLSSQIRLKQTAAQLAADETL